MSDAQSIPMVMAAPGVVANDGHDHFWSPRNIIAFAMVILFGAIELLPYWVSIPTGRNGDLILQGSKTIEVIIMLVLGFFFATTVNAQRQQDTIRQQALNQQALPAPDPAGSMRVDAPAIIELKEPRDDPDAARQADGAASVSEAPRLQPGDDGLPE